MIRSRKRPKNVRMSSNSSEDFRVQVMRFYEETKKFEHKVSIVIPSIFAVVIIVGLVGNLLVIFVALNRQMRNSTNTLIIGRSRFSLLVQYRTYPIGSDVLDAMRPIHSYWLCVSRVDITHVDVSGHQLFTGKTMSERLELMCFQHVAAYFSVWTLTLMAADRFLAVCYPVESMTLRTPINTAITLLITYTLILISQIQVARIHDVYRFANIRKSIHLVILSLLRIDPLALSLA